MEIVIFLLSVVCVSKRLMAILKQLYRNDGYVLRNETLQYFYPKHTLAGNIQNKYMETGTSDGVSSLYFFFMACKFQSLKKFPSAINGTVRI